LRTVTGGQTEYANELGYEVRLERWHLKLYREEQSLIEVGVEFNVAGEL